jgi:dTDP-glucose 4,6-dehydratase
LGLGNVVVTGGLGFIGSHFIRQILTSDKYGAESVVNIDFMGYGSSADNLRDIVDTKYNFTRANINNKEALESIARMIDIDIIVNFAAETHVDRSISNPAQFVDSNTNGVISLLEFCRLHDIRLFVQISTDEVYGDADEAAKQSLDECSPMMPNSPYSASKAAADLFTRAYNRTYGLPSIITRCSNNFGPNQFPEKLIPKAIIRALKGLAIPIYGDGRQVRQWIYVNDHVDAILKAITHGKYGEIYNVSSSNEISNIEVISKIRDALHSTVNDIEVKIEHVQDRPGHDRRYSLNSSKIKRGLAWKPAFSFDSALEQTVKWYVNNDWWWKPLLTSGVLEPEPWKVDWG